MTTTKITVLTTKPTTTTAKTGVKTTPTTTITTTTSEEAKEEQVDDLLNETQDTSNITASEVSKLVGNLEKLLDAPSVSPSVGQKAIGVISNLMDVGSNTLSGSANRLIHLVDDLGLKLIVTEGGKGIISSASLVLAVRTVDGTNFPATSADIFNTDNVQLRALRRRRSERSGPLGSVYLPTSLTSGLSPEEQQQANRVQFTFYKKSSLFQDKSLVSQTLISPVLGSSVANLSIRNLRENIKFTIRHIDPVQTNNSNTSCVYWNFSLNGGEGGWGSDGCTVVNATPDYTTCSCSHLTSFSILLDLSREGQLDPVNNQILTYITYIGCGISSVFLAFTLLTYFLFEKLLRDIPAKILVQLCISLLLLNLVFLLNSWLTLFDSVGLCISTGFFLHYFLLASFTWAGLEALHMYLSIIRVFTPYLSRYMLSCWLRNDIAFYLGVVAYFLVIFVLCLVVFIVVMVQLYRIKKQNPQNQSPNRGVMTDLRSATGLVILLGLTWGFALFAWGPLYVPFIYLFSIFNSLQGFFVFVLHCAIKESVRRQWRIYFCCGKLAENSELSVTASKAKRNLSLGNTTGSNPYPPSWSSVSSSLTNSSCSVFADSGISDASNSDVQLNEMHRQSRVPRGGP
ncbi:unnamed protein product [Menidia menidia]|uniref:(Atlantic silverside) hypothetical protein n=1 Tax=Menidia menidia TaxID=238744 RepID=A0A8S4AQ04_9TELE|nr:unnamed protein product [Menidia menidia]